MDLNLNEGLCTLYDSAEVMTITTMIMVMITMITMMMAVISPLITMPTTMMVSWRSDTGQGYDDNDNDDYDDDNDDDGDDNDDDNNENNKEEKQHRTASDAWGDVGERSGSAPLLFCRKEIGRSR